MDGGQAVVVAEMQHGDLEDEWGMRGLDVMFWAELQGNGVFPFFKLAIQLADSVEKLPVRLFGSLDRVQALVDITLDDREGAHQSEQVHCSFSVCKWNVADVVCGELAG